MKLAATELRQTTTDPQSHSIKIRSPSLNLWQYIESCGHMRYKFVITEHVQT